MENMTLWHALSATPKEARKTIVAGRLKGFTDINPMWRLRMLTELFGACGVGWKFEILDKWTERGANDEQSAFVLAALYIKESGEWSAPIIGFGGSSFVAKERNGLYTSDESYKMAFTDAIGSCCKMLGMSEDVYFEQGYSKYMKPVNNAPAEKPKAPPKQTPPPAPAPLCERCGGEIKDVTFKNGAKRTAADIMNYSKQTFGAQLCYSCTKSRITEANAENQGG